MSTSTHTAHVTLRDTTQSYTCFYWGSDADATALYMCSNVTAARTLQAAKEHDCAEACMPVHSYVIDAARRSIALLPLFNASSGYLRDKISSTVLTSVSVGVPMVVPPTFLEVYTEFKREHVIIMVSCGLGFDSCPSPLLLILFAHACERVRRGSSISTWWR